MILAQREMLAAAQNEAKVRALEIERLKLQLAKARRQANLHAFAWSNQIPVDSGI